jgi:hypothetical protein
VIGLLKHYNATEFASAEFSPPHDVYEQHVAIKSFCPVVNLRSPEIESCIGQWVCIAANRQNYDLYSPVCVFCSSVFLVLANTFGRIVLGCCFQYCRVAGGPEETVRQNLWCSVVSWLSFPVSLYSHRFRH